MVTRGHIKDIYTLTPMQEGMLFHALRDPSSAAYFEQMSYRLHGPLDIETVKKSLNELMKRYDVLRTLFIVEGTDRPIQVVLKEREADFFYEDAAKTATKEGINPETRIKEFKEKDRQRLFALGQDVLIRVSVLQIARDEYEFIWSFHHIIMDGWCIGILMSDFWEIYNSYHQNRVYRLPDVTPYSAYITWLEKLDREKSREYWKKYLEGYKETVIIPNPDGNDININRRKEDGYKPDMIRFVLAREKTDALNKLAGRNKVTVNRIIQTIWGILLTRYNRREDVVFGVVVSGRPSEIPGVESMVGLFINTIPMRIRFNNDTDTTFNQLLQTVHQEAIESEPHHYSPLAEIQSDTPLKQNLLNHIMVFENFPIEKKIDFYSAVEKRVENNRRNSVLKSSRFEIFEHTNYDFNIMVVPEDQLTIRFQYNANAYERKSVEHIASHFRMLIGQLLISTSTLTKKEQHIREMEMVSEEEKKQLLQAFNNLEEDFPNDEATTIHSLFETQVEKTPRNLALKYAGRQLTYSQLNQKVNQLAWVLRNKGIFRDSVVGVMVGRSIELVISIIAIMKAGGAYLPVDAEYPEERKKYMLENSGVSILLTNYKKENVSEFVPDTVEVLDVSKENLYSGEADNNPEYINKSTDLVYVIYTSGSTGKPKGVMLEHRNLVNLIIWGFRFTNLDFSSVLQFATISFDVSFHEIFSTLLSGGRLYLIEKEIRTDIPKLFNLIESNQIKTLFLPISVLKIIFSEEDYIQTFPACVEHIQTAGEQVVISDKFRNYLRENKIYLHNHYGPSEAHVVTALTLDPGGEIPGLPPIGKPVSNTAIYILDKYGHMQPIGVPGELYIGGIQVGRGYLGKVEATLEKFINDPFAAENRIGNRMYRTGDLARWRPDGNIDFLGRIDLQVKIRGYRIEPGEVESQLLNHPHIKEAIVNTGENEKKEKYLCAYFVSNGTLTPQELKKYLSAQLPEYMIPTFFIQLEEMPMLPNGKINYKALPDPKTTASAGMLYEPPANKTERKIIEIWAEVLELDPQKIGRNDDFFELGGNSINILKVLSRVKKEFKQDISMSSLFLNKKASELAANIYEEGILNKLECVIKLSEGHNQNNIFIIHPLHGMIYQYKGLAKLLENEVNVYAIQARGLVRRSKFPETFDHLVADYIHQIRQIQEQGPYVLIGYCFGDMIAFCMVRMMEQMGLKVKKLIMLDEPIFLPDYAISYYRRKGRNERLLRPFKKLWTLLKGKNYKNLIVLKYEQLVKEMLDSQMDVDTEKEITPDETIRMQTQVKVNLKRMMDKYYRTPTFKQVYGFIDADLVDIKAKELKHPDFGEKRMNQFTFGEFRFYVSPGGHETMLEKPHVETLVEIIRNNI
jgi:amino acid adenylation domain-containing protein